jgi:hypothetical protein
MNQDAPSALSISGAFGFVNLGRLQLDLSRHNL